MIRYERGKDCTLYKDVLMNIKTQRYIRDSFYELCDKLGVDGDVVITNILKDYIFEFSE